MPSFLGGNPLEVDTVILGALESPGRATVVKAGSPRDWETRKGFGLSGAYLLYTGENLQDFDIIIDLWKFPEHWVKWLVFSKILEKPRPGIKPIALGIAHPAVNSPPLSITEIVVTNVTQFEQTDDGMWSCSITCRPYKKPLPVLGKPLEATPATSKRQLSAQDAGEEKLLEVRQEYLRLKARVALLGTAQQNVDGEGGEG